MLFSPVSGPPTVGGMDAPNRTYLPSIRYLRIFHVVKIVFIREAAFY